MKTRAAYLLFVLITLLFSCKGDNLKEEYQILEGTYEWTGTGTMQDIWTHGPVLDPSVTSYTAGIELNDKSEILFYKNGALISKETYKFLDKESYAGGAHILIKLKGKTSKSWGIEQKLDIRLSQDTSLTIDKYPFPAIDKAENYFSGHTSQSNSFLKK